MTAKFTKGPWKYKFRDWVDGGVKLRGREVGPALILSNFPPGTKEGDRAEADAKLIAASPTMLEALKKIANYAPEMEGREWNPVEAYLRLKEIAREAAKLAEEGR